MGNYIDMDDIDSNELFHQYDYHDTAMFWYDAGINRFVDASFGNVIHDIFRFLHPWQILLFKSEKESMTFPDVTDSFLIELIYPDEFYTKHS